MKQLIYPVVILFLFNCGNADAQNAGKIIQKGNEYYKKHQYDDALKEYSKINEGDLLRFRKAA